MGRFLLVLLALLLNPSWQRSHVVNVAEAGKGSKRNAKRPPKAKRTATRSSSLTTKRKSSIQDNRLSRVAASTHLASKPERFISVASVRARVVAAYQRAAAGHLTNPVRHLRAEFGEALLSPESEAGLSELEDDVIDLLRIPPRERHRMWKKIEAAVFEKYGLDKLAWLTVYGFYAEQVFGNDVRIVGGRQSKIRDHFEILRRSLSLSEPRTSTQKRYLYYLANLRRKSAPEMALELGISQVRVYSDFSVLSLSREAAFADMPSRVLQSRIVERLKKENTSIDGCQSDCALSFLELAKRLHSKGWSRQQIAEVLSLGGSGGLIYFLAPNGVRRGSEWTGSVDIGQGLVLEELALLQLYGRGLSTKDIAHRLNVAKRVTDSRSDSFRTQKSVQKRLNRLGVRIYKSSKYPLAHKIKNYGAVKANGELEVEAAKKFIYDHVRSQTIPKMAADLAVSPNTLRRFIAKYHLPSPSSSREKESDEKKVQERIASAVKQYEVDAPTGLPASLRRKRRTSAQALANAVSRMEFHKKVPATVHKLVANMTGIEKDDKDAANYIRNHPWTQEEIDALPAVSREIVQPLFLRQQKGERAFRTPEQSLANAVERMEYHKEMPPTTFRPVEGLEKEQLDDNAATKYIRRHRWTKAEVDALPRMSQGIVRPVYRRQQKGEKLLRTPEQSFANAIARTVHHKKMPPQSSKLVRDMTPSEKLDHAASKFIRSHKWTNEEIAKLPDVARLVVKPFYKRQQTGTRLSRTPAESYANAVARMEHYQRVPPSSKKPVDERTDVEKKDTIAADYIRRRKWKQAEIDALPDVSRGIVNDILEAKRQRAAKKKAK